MIFTNQPVTVLFTYSMGNHWWWCHVRRLHGWGRYSAWGCVCRFAVGVKAWWIRLDCTNSSRGPIKSFKSNKCSLCVGYRLQLIMYFITSWMNNFFFTAPVSGWDLPGSMWTWTSEAMCYEQEWTEHLQTAVCLGCSRAVVISIHQNWSVEVTVVNQQGHGRLTGAWYCSSGC